MKREMMQDGESGCAYCMEDRGGMYCFAVIFSRTYDLLDKSSCF